MFRQSCPKRSILAQRRASPIYQELSDCHVLSKTSCHCSEGEGISSALREAALSDEEQEEEEGDEAADSGGWVKPLTAAQRRRYEQALADGPRKEVRLARLLHSHSTAVTASISVSVLYLFTCL